MTHANLKKIENSQMALIKSNLNGHHQFICLNAVAGITHSCTNHILSFLLPICFNVDVCAALIKFPSCGCQLYLDVVQLTHS